MNIYIKVPPLIANRLNLTSLKNAKLPDGNYVALKTQFVKLLDNPFDILERAPQMGCAILKPGELRLEKEGELVTPLPSPTDPEYMEPEAEAEESQVQTENEEGGNE